MSVKAVYACLMVLFFATMPAIAQDGPPSTSDIVAHMQSKLNLTQDQVAAVTPIIEKYSSKRQDLHQSMEDGTADPDSMRTQMKQLKDQEAQELSQVLSAQQMSQWNSMQPHGRHKYNGNSSSDSNGEGSDHAGADDGPALNASN